MASGLSRRNFIKLGTFAGISVMFSRLSDAEALEVQLGPSKANAKGDTNWIGSDGKARFRWDAVRKVTGGKTFARDYRSKNIPGWTKHQSHAFFVKAAKADRTFEGIDLSILDKDLQPDRILLHEDLERDGLRVPQASDLAEEFFGRNFLVPKGTTPPLLGHPVALLVYKDFERFELAKRSLRFETEIVRYGELTGPKPPQNYGAARYVRIGGATPTSSSVYAPVQDAVIFGNFNGNDVVWPDESKSGIFVPRSVLTKHRGGGGRRDPEAIARETFEPMRRGMKAADQITKDIEAARKNPAKFVLDRKAFSQSIDASALEADNGNAWYDAHTRTLHIIAATQSPYDVGRLAAIMVKDNKTYPVDEIKLLSGVTVGYGTKDHSIFPLYSIMAAFYGNGHAVRLANDRYEQFQMGLKRHSMHMDVSIVADRESGQFEIMKGQYVINGGGRANFSFSVAQVAATAAQSIYYLPKSDLSSVALASHAVEAGSMRGYGALQVMSVTEMMVDEIANALEIDAIELRRRNALKAGYENTQGAQPLGDPRNIEMLNLAAENPLWTNRHEAKKEYDTKNPGRLYGVGFSQVQKDYGSGADTCVLALEFDATGHLIMRHCVQEIGTGATTAQQILVQDILGKVPDNAEFGVTDFPELPLVSEFSPYTITQEQQDEAAKNPYWVPAILPAMSASNSAYFLSFGTRQAALFLLEYTLWPAAKAIWSEGPAGGQISSGSVGFPDIRAGSGGISGGGMETLSFERLARKAHEMGIITGVAVHCFSRWEWANAEFDVPGIGKKQLFTDALAIRYGDGASSAINKRIGTAGYEYINRLSVNYPPVQRNNAGVTTLAPASCLVELNVNTFTGEVEIMTHHSILDPGKIIVPQLVSGQQQGGLAMGIGHALMEELPLYEDGPGDGTWNFNRYTLPRASNVAVWKQTAEYLPPLSDTSPPKGMAEVVTIPIIPAIGNAIAHATNKRFFDFPITPAKIKHALRSEPTAPLGQD